MSGFLELGAIILAAGMRDIRSDAFRLEQALLPQVGELRVESSIKGDIQAGCPGFWSWAQLYWPPACGIPTKAKVSKAARAATIRCASIAGCGARGSSSRERSPRTPWVAARCT